MKTFFVAKVLGFLMVLNSVAAAYPVQAVQYGGEEGLDACGGYGVVTVTTVISSLDDQGYQKFDVIPAGTTVSSCDYASNLGEEYVGIVYGEKGQTCGSSSPVPERIDYKGPCRSGWILNTYFYLIAG